MSYTHFQMYLEKNTIIVTFVIFLFYVLPINAAPTGPPPKGGWRPDTGITFGGAAAYTHAGYFQNAFTPSLEFSFFNKLNIPLFAWGTLGVKPIISKQDSAISPYLETGLTLLLFNLGLGWGPSFSEKYLGHQLNLFLGAGIPLRMPKRGRVLYVSPFYRPMLYFYDKTYFGHEVGIMLKWMIVLKRKLNKR
jgi:hypothetical protein